MKHKCHVCKRNLVLVTQRNSDAVRRIYIREEGIKQ